MSGWARGLFAREIRKAKPQLEPLRCSRLDVVPALQFGLFGACYRYVGAFSSPAQAIAITLCADASQALEFRYGHHDCLASP